MNTTPHIFLKVVGLLGEELPPGVYDCVVTNTREITRGRWDGDLAIRAKVISPAPQHIEDVATHD